MRLTISELQKKYNINNQTISKWIKKGLLQVQPDYKFGQAYLIEEEEFLKVKKFYWNDSQRMSYTIGWNRDIFEEIDTPEKAYWLGFILADGCLHLTHKDNFVGHFSIDISARDKEHLYKFSNFIEAQQDIVQFTTHPDTGNLLAHIQLCCSKTNKDLFELGIKPNKSGREKWITTPYPADFIRGYYDGDGYIKKDLHSIGLVGSYELLSQIQLHFFQELNIMPKTIGKHGIIYRIEYTAKDDKKKIANYLWYDNCISLNRKQKLADEIKKIC